MRPKILVSAFSNLYTDQRIEKVCETLYRAGYEIELIGNDWGGSQKMERPYKFSILRLKTSSLRTAYVKFNWQLYFELQRRADQDTVLLANDLDALWPNVLISKKLGIPLVFDSHEIFTEMPAIQGRFTQKIWRWLEGRLLPRIKFMMTESQSYAEWFTEKYDVHPVVVRNIPRRIDEPIQIVDNQPKVMLYQGAINQARGIAQAILATKYLDNIIFKIAGDGPRRAEYEQLVQKENLQHKVKFLGKLIPAELRKLTRTADVALSIEENGGVSYLYSLPNKVGDCIQARVPMILINFPEMLRIYKKYKVGEIVENHDPKNLAAKIQIILDNGRSYYQPALSAAAQEYCWENEEAKILALFRQVREEAF